MLDEKDISKEGFSKQDSIEDNDRIYRHNFLIISHLIDIILSTFSIQTRFSSPPSSVKKKKIDYIINTSEDGNFLCFLLLSIFTKTAAAFFDRIYRLA